VKYIFLIFCLAGFSSAASAQETKPAHDDELIGTRTWKAPPLPLENGRVVYKGEVDLGRGFPRERAYSKALEWLRNNLKSDDVRIHIMDKPGGQIAGEGKITYNQSVVSRDAAQAIYFNYDIRVRDGGYSYRIDQLHSTIEGKAIDYTVMYAEDQAPVAGREMWSAKYRYEMLSDLNSYITLFISGLKSDIVK
jgi:hypothetical protein